MFTKRKSAFLIGLFFLFCFVFTWLVQAQQIVYPRGVADGDTVFLTNGQSLRLACIDAPEIDHQGQFTQYYGVEAKNFLWSLIKDKSLTLKDVKKDRFGRILAQVYLPDGRWLNKIMIRKGYAFYFPHRRQACVGFLDEQHLAMEQKVGFWPKILSMPEARQVFLGNKNSRRFHRKICLYGLRTSPRNRIWFTSLYQAFWAGYAPARCCTVWPLESRP